MDRKFLPFPTDLVQMHPGLGILRFAALLAEGSESDDDTLDLMFEQMEIGALDNIAPHEIWLELERGLMAPAPAIMIKALRECGVLEIVLPEIASLWGVPQIADDPGEVDLGEHLLNQLSEAAKIKAPLPVRFALLTMNVGKSDSPREHLPSHYRHIERGAPRIRAIAERFRVPDACRDLALLALHECERVHRTSKMRAGPVADMLERVGAFRDPAQFALLMSVCSCDYYAYGGRTEPTYPKAALLDIALKACAQMDDGAPEDRAPADGTASQEVQEARATAIARAFRSERWSDETA